MTVQVKETINDGLKRGYHVSVPAGVIEAQLNAKLTQISKTVKIPGFRPGKVPMPVLRQRYGDSVRGEVLEKSVQQGVLDTYKSQNIKPAGDPKIEVKAFTDDKGLEFTLEVELIPSIPQPDYGTIALEKLTIAPSQSDIDAALQGIADNNKVFAAPAKARAARDGDRVTIDFLGKVGDVAFEGGSATDFPLELGSKQFIPGFEDQLIGIKEGETRDLSVTFPAEYKAELAGKDAVFTVTAKKIEERQPTLLNDDLAKKMGYDTLEALTKAVTERLQARYDQLTQQRLKRHLLDKLDALVKMELPASLVDGEKQTIQAQQKAEQPDHVHDEHCTHEHDEALDPAELQKIAERRVKLGLLLADYGEKHGINVTNDEVHKAILAEAQKYPGYQRQVLEYYKDNPQAIASIRAPIYEEKIINILLSKVSLTSKTVSAEDFRKAEDADLEQYENETPKPAKKAAKAKAEKPAEEAAEASAKPKKPKTKKTKE